MNNGIIRLNNVECRDCYKCIRNCPVKAIRYSDGRAEIIDSECILCGECVVTCPQRGDFLESQVDAIRRMIERGRRLVASSIISPVQAAARPMGAAISQARPVPARMVTMGVTRMSIFVSLETSLPHSEARMATK